MKKLKVAQIGTGHDHAVAIFDSLLSQPDLFEVKGYYVCEGKIEQEQYEQNIKTYSKSQQLTLEEILNDTELDAIAIECEEVQLTKYAHMALEKGFPIHMDKPGSEDPEAFAAMVNCAKEKNLPLHFGYMYRYNPAVLHTLELVDNGKLGKIYSVETHMDCLHPADKRQWLDTFQGGMLFFLGCHLIDLILRIQGEPEEIIPLSTSTGFDGVTGKDYGMVVFKYPNGVSFAKTCAAEPGGFPRRQLVVCGEKGTIEIKPFEKYVGNGLDRNTQITGIREVYKEDAEKIGWGYEGSYRETAPENRYDNMMASFAAIVRGEKENPYSYEYELKLHEVLMKACGYK